jgi:C4-dicarboxylate transporter DctQ subunit
VMLYDVALRNLLISPPAWIVPTIEYGLLYITMLAAPWLLRIRGHVMVEALHQRLPDRIQKPLEKTVHALCFVICVIVVGYVAHLLMEAYASGEADVRAITVPHTYLYWPMLVGFILVGCEFLRYLFGRHSLFRHSIMASEELKP